MVTFGFVNNPLKTLDATVRHVYAPLLKEQGGNGEWDKATLDASYRPPERVLSDCRILNMTPRVNVLALVAVALERTND